MLSVINKPIIPNAYYQNAMHYSAYRALGSNALFKCDILRTIFRAAQWSKRWKIKQRNAAEFLGSILHHANLFSKNFWVRFSITPIYFQCF